MAAYDSAPEPELRLSEDVQAWLPTDDLEAHRSIVAFLASIMRTGVDPIAALREALTRWFGTAARDLLPLQITTDPTSPSEPDVIALEPLPRLRRPTLWPQRPKRFPDELFSSWLWRASVAAGAPPNRFASEALGGCFADADAEVPEPTLHRLAMLSGQPVSYLASGTVIVAHPLTRADMVLKALLEHGGFLLTSKRRAARPHAVLQYCPRCLAEDPHPYFRRGWRFAIEAICVRHRCRLHDACWCCGAFVDLLHQTIASREPLCARCGAVLARGTVSSAADAVRGQRGLPCLLYYAAVCFDAVTLRLHLDILGDRFPPGSRVVERTRVLRGLLAGNLDCWFGRIADPSHRGVMEWHAQGRAYSAWFGSGGGTFPIGAAELAGSTRPLSRQKRPRAPWFAPSAGIPPAAPGGTLARSAQSARLVRAAGRERDDGGQRAPAA